MARTIEEIVGEVFEIEPTTVTDALGPDDVESWDSLNHLKLVGELEREFGIKLKMKEVQALLSVGKIREIVSNRLGAPK